ncbi:MAG: hypothetical protein ACR2IT_07140, partial [Pirellulales bacterium]
MVWPVCFQGVSPRASAADVYWSGSTGSYGTPANWSTGSVPTVSDVAIINNGGTSLLTVSGSTTGAIQRVGQDGVGFLTVDGGGTFTTSGSTWIGLTQAGSATSGVGTLTVTGSSTFRRRGGKTIIGGGAGNSSGTLSVGLGSSFLHETTTYVDTFIVGDLTQSGSHSGTLNVNGGTVNTGAAEFWAGNKGYGSGAGSGVVNVSNGGSVTTGNWTVFGRQNGAGTLNISGGSFTKGGDGDFVLGDSGTSRGTVVQTGGDVRVNTGLVRIGAWGGSGNYTLSGGTFTNASSNGVEIGGGGGSNSSVSVSGGLWDVQTSYLDVGSWGGGTGRMTISGSGEVRSPTTYVGHWAANTTGILNLEAGGVLKTGLLTGGETQASSTVNIDGGRMVATASRTDFVTNLDAVNLRAGGA